MNYTQGSLDTRGIRAFVADLITGRDHRYPARAIAIVAPPGRTFGDAMQHRACAGGSKSGREVFHTREDAIAWLARQR